jgi:hypothetical protein
MLGRPAQRAPKAQTVNAAAVANNNELLLCSLCADQGILESSSEVCLAGLTFPKDINLLQDPDIFIVDTGLTCHSTKCNNGLTNLHKADQNHTMTMANGTKELSTKVRDLKGVICNKEGQEVSLAIMKDVTYLPGGHFNIFSCLRLQQEGWIMHGDKESIKLTKGNAVICFEIVVPQ